MVRGNLYPFRMWISRTDIQSGLLEMIVKATVARDTSSLLISIWIILLLALILRLIAALGAAVYPPFIYFSFVGLTETLFTTLILAAYVCWYRGAFAAAAVFAVLSILTRPAIDLLAPLLVVYFAAVAHRFTATAVL